MSRPESNSIGNVSVLKQISIKGPVFDYSELLFLMEKVNKKIISYGHETYFQDLLTLLTRLERHLVRTKEVENLVTVIELKERMINILRSPYSIDIKITGIKTLFGVYKDRMKAMAVPRWALSGHVEGGTRRSRSRSRSRSRRHNQSRK